MKRTVKIVRWSCPEHHWNEIGQSGDLHGSCSRCGGYLVDYIGVCVYELPEMVRERKISFSRGRAHACLHD